MNTHTPVVTAVVGLVVALVAVAVVPAPVAADDGDDVLGEVGDELREQAGRLSNLSDVVDGVVNRVRYAVSGPESDRTPESSLTETADLVNNRSGETVAWLNDHYAPPASNQTVRVKLVDGDTIARRYVEVDANGSEWQAVRVVNSTDRTVTDTVRLEGQWVDTLPDETRKFYDIYVENGTRAETDDPFARRLAGQYKSDTESSLLSVMVVFAVPVVGRVGRFFRRQATGFRDGVMRVERETQWEDFVAYGIGALVNWVVRSLGYAFGLSTPANQIAASTALTLTAIASSVLTFGLTFAAVVVFATTLAAGVLRLFPAVDRVWSAWVDATVPRSVLNWVENA
jgi:hypothetical protein